MATPKSMLELALAMDENSNRYDQALAESNPYTPLIGATDAIQQAVISRGVNAKPGEAALYGLASGLLGGLMQKGGERYTNEQRGAIDALNASLLFGGTPEQPRNIPRSVFDDLSRSRSVFGAKQQLAEIKKQEELAKEQEKLLFEAKIKAADRAADRAAARDLAIFKAKVENPYNAGMIDDILAGRPVSEPSVATDEPGATAQADPFGTGVESLASKINRRALELRRLGTPPGAAINQASRELKDEMKSLEGSVDFVSEARAKADQLDALSQKADLGIEGAGKTGGALGGPREVLSSLYAIVSPEEQQQRAKQALLDQVQQEAIGALRVKGTGALSDLESKTLMKSAPSPARTPQENRELNEAFKRAATAEREYADFLDAYRRNYGSLEQASEVWQEYKKANPVFIIDPKTSKLIPNEDRVSWREHFAQNKASKSELRAEARRRGLIK